MTRQQRHDSPTTRQAAGERRKRARRPITPKVVRAAVRAAFHAPPSDGGLDEVLFAAGGPMYEAAYATLDSIEPNRDGSVDVGQTSPTALWDDLRPSEAAALFELVDKARQRARKRCRRIILAELTAAGVAFAERFPDAPRPTPVG